MLEWRMRCTAAVLGVWWLGMLIGCGTSVSSGITPTSAMLLPGQTFQFNIIKTGSEVTDPHIVFLVDGEAGGSPSKGTITAEGLYTAPATASGKQFLVSVKGQSGSAAVTIFDPSNFTAGSVATTQNPLVASYSIPLPVGAAVHVQFGPDTNYGFPTSVVQAPTNGGTATVLVAGMRASTTYHMQAVVDLVNGSHLLDKDQTFATASIPADRLPLLTTQLSGVGTPNAGIELLSLLPDNGGNVLSTVATDLAGNVIWYYDLESANFPFPVKLLPNGHMLLVASPVTLTGFSDLREIDLAGNIINRITIDQLNQALAGVASFHAGSFHHDFAVLPNGHWMLLVNHPKTINGVPGIPDGTAMLGDALVEWDPQRGPVWTWSSFDHLDVTHAPTGLTDWTHANAVVYSPDDGNLIVSMRNQNLIIKIDYRNGTGDGSVLWRFGPGGDFTLPGLQAPIEWNYGQHYPTILSPNSSGLFTFMFFNNGNNRLMNSSNVICSSPGVGACYSSVPVFQVDEFTKTATVLSEVFPPFYSICCGDALVLPNGNTEFDVAFDILGPPNTSHIQEVTPTHDLVWQMDISGQLAYRGLRVPSLYPGQRWPAVAQSDPGQSAATAARVRKARTSPTIPISRLP